MLQDSHCVSDRFIHRLSGLCDELHGNARMLIQWLNDGKVERWRQNNTESLEVYLRDNGYLEEEAPLTPDDLRARVLAFAADSLHDGRLTIEHINRILHAVGT